MQLQKAERKKAWIKVGIQGPSGSGKTFSALLLAFGLTEDWSKIAVVDTENHSAHLYDFLGPYQVLPLEAPFSPERYIEAIRYCVKEGIQVVIIDSISHEWESSGGILDVHSQMAGNSFTNWAKLTPRHTAFVQEILQSPVHIIANMRTKQDYVLVDKNGKTVPEKVGMKSITREGMEYEFTLAFELDMKHNATATKDRTFLFMDKPEFKISTATGKAILEWCQSGKETSLEEVNDRINDCKTLQELLNIYYAYPKFSMTLQKEFEAQKKRLQIHQQVQTELANQKTNPNGTE